MADALAEALGAGRVLVAGVGNVFAGDDGFGCAVARRLADDPLPYGVRVRDYGIAGIHLAYDLLDAWDALVIVDAVERGAAPGTVTVIAITEDEAGQGRLDAHAMDPRSVLGTVRALGGRVPSTLLVGCEPDDLGAGMALSPAVEKAVPVAVAAIRGALTRRPAATAGRR